MRNDILRALRNMPRSPGFFAVAWLTIALGIGACTAVFSVIHEVLLKPLPYAEADRLTAIYARIPRLKIDGAFVEYNTFVEWWRAHSKSFEAMAAYTPGTATMTSGGQPQRLRLVRVSSSYLTVIGIRPALGRDFLPAEDEPGAPHVVILSDSLWKQRFGADRGVLGRSVVLDGTSYDVIGVLPPGVDLTPGDVFTPIAHSGARVPGMPAVGTYARLKPGVAVSAAQAEIDTLCRGWVQQYHYPKDWGARVWPIREYLVRNVRSSVTVLAIAVALVLLIACANVANLLLARAGARQREIAIRTALGAGRGRIAGQLLSESVVLAVPGSALGLLLAWASLRLLAAADTPFPFLSKVSVNTPVLAFTVAAAALAAVLFGLAPALAASRASLLENLKESGRGSGEGPRRSRLGDALVVAEVALALLLVIGATLTARSLVNLLSVDPGFRPEGVLTAQITLPRSSYGEPGRRLNFFKELLERLESTPGVTSASMVSDLPFGGSKSGSNVRAEGAPPPQPGGQEIAFSRAIDPEYFRALDVRLIRGRFFRRGDPPAPPAAIINETLARRLWPAQDPVGKRFSSGRTGPLLTVAGVVADARNTSLADDPDAEFFVPYAQRPVPDMSLVVRTALEPQRLASAVRAAVAELDQGVPVSGILPLSAGIARSTGTRRFSAALLGGFALAAMLLAAIGIYGVVSYAVTRRTREIGVRMALGAARGRIAADVVGRALLLGGAGILLGLGASFALMRLLQSLLFGVSSTDPAVLAGSAVFLLGVSAAAAWLPALRASRVDPVVALREE